jgi:hypothetical protein
MRDDAFLILAAIRCVGLISDFLGSIKGVLIKTFSTVCRYLIWVREFADTFATLYRSRKCL